MRPGVLLDGFPRNAQQAAALDVQLAKNDTPLDAVLVLDVPDEEIMERITGRRLDPLTGDIYHVKFNPPPPEVAGRVVRRPDDTAEVCRSRLEKYHAETAAVVTYYETKGLVRHVGGVGERDEVTNRIFKTLSDL